MDECGFIARIRIRIRSRGEEAKAIKRKAGFKARRWVVERAHSLLNRIRRIVVCWDKYPENYIAFLHFANAERKRNCIGWCRRRQSWQQPTGNEEVTP